MNKTIYILVILLLFSSLCYSQEISVPVDIQIPIIFKIINFDRNTNKRINQNKELKVGILYQNKYRSSYNAKESILNYITNNKNNYDFKISYYLIEANNTEDISEFLKNNQIDIIIITPLRAINISSIGKLFKHNNIISFSLVYEYVYSDISVGIESIQEKAQIVINLSSSKKEGADFNSQLLKLAKIINKE